MKGFLVACHTTLVMDTGETAFIRGNTYVMSGQGVFIKTVNEQGKNHYFDDYGVDDYNHWFEIVSEGSLNK